MILQNPVRGTIHVNAANYPQHPDAWTRPSGNDEPALTQDFGPSSVTAEPTIVWPGGEGISAGTYANFHLGIDISTSDCGRDVLAAGAGKVTTSGKNGVGAEVIVIDHGGGVATRYVHMSTRLVAVGAIVAVGKVIGKIGNTGISSGCHLHFGVTEGGKYVDPWRRLAQNQEEDMPAITTNLTGQTAKINNPNGDVNVRDGVTPDAKVTRQIPKGQSESWTVVGWVTGWNTAGSDQWLARVNGTTWEYVHKINVAEVAPPVGDPDALTKAKAAGYAEAKAKAGVAVAGI